MARDSSKGPQSDAMMSAELQALLDAAVDAIVVIDESSLIMTFNRAAERMFGYAAVDVIGKSVTVLMAEPHRSQHQVGS